MANWSELPEELLILILRRLQRISDFVRFGSICSYWRSVLLENPYQFPGTIFSVDPTKPSDSGLRFLPLSESDAKLRRESPSHSCSLRLPTQHEKCECIIGWHQGWLVMRECSSPPIRSYLANPLTGAKLALPHITDLPQYYDWKFPIQVFKTVLSSSPSSTLPCYVLFFYRFSVDEVESNTVRGVAYCKIGDKYWRPIEPPTDNIFSNAVFCKGQCYLRDPCGRIYSFDVNATSPARITADFIADPPRVNRNVFTKFYLAELEGELVTITMDLFSDKLQVHKLDSRYSNWVDVESLGKYALFIDRRQSWSLSTAQGPGIKGNCIYFLGCACSVSIYNVGNATTECLGLEYNSWNLIWFTPAVPWCFKDPRPENSQPNIASVADELTTGQVASSSCDHSNTEIEKFKPVGTRSRRRRRRKNKKNTKKDEAEDMAGSRADQVPDDYFRPDPETLSCDQSNEIEKFNRALSKEKKKKEEEEEEDMVPLRDAGREKKFTPDPDGNDGTSPGDQNNIEIERFEHAISNKMTKSKKYMMNKKYRKKKL